MSAKHEALRLPRNTALTEYDRHVIQLDNLQYLNERWRPDRWQGWINRIDPEGKRHIETKLNEKNPIVYFSAEYGLPGMGYNGGLGVLSGDHFLEAVRRQQPGVFIGLGYDRRKKQTIVSNDDCTQCWQQEEVVPLPSAKELGFKPADNLDIQINTPEGRRKIEVNRYGIGTDATTLYRMEVGSEVYPSQNSSDERLRNNAVLGFGGYEIVKQLKAQGIINEPPIYHLNESATVLGALALLDDRVATLMEQGIPEGIALAQALDFVASRTLLTNHTLVPAADGFFNRGQVDAFISNNLQSEVTKKWLDGFMGKCDGNLPLNELALQLAGTKNGVSRLHADIATGKFREIYKDKFGREILFNPVTNGVFAERWNQPMMDLMEHLGIVDEFGLPEEDKALRNQRIDQANSEDFMNIKAEAVGRLRDYLADGNKRDQFGHIINIPADAILIGEARRVAEYKRRKTLFNMPDQLRQLLIENPKMHIMLSGKAHPSDQDAKDQLSWVLNTIKDDPLFRERIHYIVDYDIELAQHLEPAVHVWVNTPRVGEEACGTSGMKTGLNALQVSTRDGFYAELDDDSYNQVIGQTDSDWEKWSFYIELKKSIKAAQSPEQFVAGVKRLWKGGFLDVAMGSRMLRQYHELMFPQVK